jgi:hypothetical protein
LKIKSKSKKKIKRKSPARELTGIELRQIMEILHTAFHSENSRDYADSDGEGWGPALGAAANRATEFNKNLRRLIERCGEHLKLINGDKVNKFFGIVHDKPD